MEIQIVFLQAIYLLRINIKINQHKKLLTYAALTGVGGGGLSAFILKAL
jgi:hypothetical protein